MPEATNQTEITRSHDKHVMPTLLECPVFLLQEKQGSKWETREGAWFTYDEAAEFAKAIAHRIGKWRVYALGARGQLKTLLKRHTTE